VTVTVRLLDVFVALEIGSRRLRHVNAPAHPTAAGPRQPCREILAEPHRSRFVLPDRDRIFSSRLDPALPAPPPGLPTASIAGPDLPPDMRVVARSALGGLHHAYGLEKLAA